MPVINMGKPVLSDHDLALKSVRLRRSMLAAIFEAGAGHTGGGLSCLDILNVLYNRVLNMSPENFLTGVKAARNRAPASLLS